MILATLCYVKHQGKTLMLHRIKKNHDVHNGKWNGLGGKLIPPETPEECVKREVEEESGLRIQHPELRGIITFPNFSHEDHWYVYVFTAWEFEGILYESEEGSLEWIEDSKLFELNLWEGDPVFLKWITENRFFSAKFIYEQGKFISHSVVFHEMNRKN